MSTTAPKAMNAAVPNCQPPRCPRRGRAARKPRRAPREAPPTRRCRARRRSRRGGARSGRGSSGGDVVPGSLACAAMLALPLAQLRPCLAPGTAVQTKRAPLAAAPSSIRWPDGGSEPNVKAQQPGRPSGHKVSKDRDAGPVCCSGWFGQESRMSPLSSPGSASSSCGPALGGRSDRASARSGIGASRWTGFREGGHGYLPRPQDVLANFAERRRRYSHGSGRSACRHFSEQACLTRSSRQYQSGTTARKGGIFPL